MTKITLVLALLVAAAAPVAAQGTLSTQGFGYPPGQLSTSAASLGGGLAEFDPLSPVNPAALATWLRSGLYFQYAPEYRTVETGGNSDKTMTARFPLILGTVAFGSRWVLGVSTSTLLDRTWETQRSGYVHQGGDSLQFTESFRSAGAINDIRFALSYGVSQSVAIGVGGHVFSGDNRLTVNRSSENPTFAGFTESSRLNYSGAAASAGIAWQAGSALTVGVSGRFGGTIRAYRGDTLLTRADAPKRIGVGVGVTALPGVGLVARANWDGWSSLASLGEPGLQVTDAWDYGVGVDAHGPRMSGVPMSLRVGVRLRTLPFLVDGAKVHEHTYAAGVGLPIMRGASRVDIGVERANRSGVAGVSEHAWTLSLGFMVRP